MTITAETWKKLDRWLVVLIALHTFAVGAGLLLVPEWALSFGGWASIPPPFFPRQAGIFHFILGIGYLAEHRKLGTVSLLVMAKTFAVVFLLGTAVFGGAPWFVPFAGVIDGAMALAALLVNRHAAQAGDFAG